MESTNGKMELDHFSRTIFIYIVVQSRKEKIVTGVGVGVATGALIYTTKI
jgi:hypothetical protein